MNLGRARESRLETLADNGAARAVLFLTACLAALSMGGGFVAGVILAPLLVAVARRTSGPRAWGHGMLAGVLAAEVTWGATYLFIGERAPAIWLVPAVAGVAALGIAVWRRP